MSGRPWLWFGPDAPASWRQLAGEIDLSRLAAAAGELEAHQFLYLCRHRPAVVIVIGQTDDQPSEHQPKG